MMGKTIACIAAHPDDEALGAAGTLARHIKQGDRVHLVFMTDGVAARGSKDGEQERRQATYNAAKTIGIEKSNIHFHDFPDNEMDRVSLLEITKAVEAVLKTVNPEIIYTHHEGDLNIDHQLTARAVMTACRPLPDSHIEAIYAFEVLSSTEWNAPGAAHAFLPDYFVDITDHMEQKMDALKCYDVEMRDFPHTRSYENVKALNTYRGACNGVHYAEAFRTLRKIWK